jgi:hypothetical protein
MRKTELSLLLPIIAGLVMAGCGATDSDEVTPASLDPVSLLAEQPALPETYMTEEGGQPIEWGKEPGNAAVDLRTCKGGQSAFRSWSEGGVEWGMPSVAQTVCAFETEELARHAYASQSLLDVAGEDWPNFEPGSNAATVPAAAHTLDALAADEWEVGCGIGEPDSGCAVWTFRSRYGRVLTEVEFAASPGAIRFEQMRDLVKSIDSVVARGRNG